MSIYSFMALDIVEQTGVNSTAYSATATSSTSGQPLYFSNCKGIVGPCPSFTLCAHTVYHREQGRQTLSLSVTELFAASCGQSEIRLDDYSDATYACWHLHHSEISLLNMPVARRGPIPDSLH
eukprot:scaffold74387_cov18-Prasinocladus_malaysianus.AAC.1